MCVNMFIHDPCRHSVEFEYPMRPIHYQFHLTNIFDMNSAEKYFPARTVSVLSNKVFAHAHIKANSP